MKFQLNQKGIISSVAILTIGLFLLSLSMISLTGALKETAKNSNNKNGEQAFYTAEAAAREGVYQYINGNSDNGDIPSLNQILDNSFEISGFPRKIVATAKSDKDYFRKIIYEMNVTSGEAFNHAIFSENKLTLNGNAEVSGSVFINDEITLNGNDAEIDGDVYSTITVNPTYIEDNKISGDAVIIDTPLSAPTINLTGYTTDAYTITFDPKNAGKTVSQYIDKKTITDKIIYIVDPSNEIKVDSDLTYFTGNITTTGDLEIKGGTYTAGTNSGGKNLIAIYVNGNLIISGDTVINGIVYVTGTTIIKSTATEYPKINGSLISMGKVTIQSANAVINYDADNIGDLGDILGLDPISAASPTISSWREE